MLSGPAYNEKNVLMVSMGNVEDFTKNKPEMGWKSPNKSNQTAMCWLASACTYALKETYYGPFCNM